MPAIVPGAHGTIEMNHSSVKQQVLPQRDGTILEKSTICGRVEGNIPRICLQRNLMKEILYLCDLRTRRYLR